MREIGLSGGAIHRCSHGIMIVFNNIDNRKPPQRGHIETLVNLPLISSTIPQIGQRYTPIVPVSVGKSQACAEWHLSTNNAMPSIKILLLGEHMHRTTLALRVAFSTPCKLSHNTTWIHARSEHMTMIAVARNYLIPFLHSHLHP